MIAENGEGDGVFHSSPTIKAFLHVRSDCECQEELTHVNWNVSPAGFLSHVWKYQKYLLAVLMTQLKNTNSSRKSMFLHWIRGDLFQLEGWRDQRAARTVQQTRGTARHLVAYENMVRLHHPVSCFWRPRFWCGDSPILGCMYEQTDVKKLPRFSGMQGCRGIKNHLVM